MLLPVGEASRQKSLVGLTDVSEALDQCRHSAKGVDAVDFGLSGVYIDKDQRVKCLGGQSVVWNLRLTKLNETSYPAMMSADDIVRYSGRALDSADSPGREGEWLIEKPDIEVCKIGPGKNIVCGADDSKVDWEVEACGGGQSPAARLNSSGVVAACLLSREGGGTGLAREYTLLGSSLGTGIFRGSQRKDFATGGGPAIENNELRTGSALRAEIVFEVSATGGGCSGESYDRAMRRYLGRLLPVGGLGIGPPPGGALANSRTDLSLREYGHNLTDVIMLGRPSSKERIRTL